MNKKLIIILVIVVGLVFIFTKEYYLKQKVHDIQGVVYNGARNESLDNLSKQTIISEQDNNASNQLNQDKTVINEKFKDPNYNDGDDSTTDHVLDKDKDGNLVQVDPNNLTKDQQQVIDNLEVMYQKYKPTYLKIIDLLRKKDALGLVNITHPCIIDQYGQEEVSSTYQDSYIPFFENYASVNLDNGTISKYIGPCGPEGLLFGETMITTSGQKKNFIIVLVKSGNGLYVADIVRNKQVSDFH